MHIEITEDDIMDGWPRDCEYCPVALAVCRALAIPPRWVNVADTMLYLHLHLDEEEWAIALPSVVKRFINDFDKGKDVHPFSFELPYEKHPDQRA